MVTPSGKHLVVPARRKIGATEVDPLDLHLPLVIVVPWALVRELRQHRRHQRRWVVEVMPSFDPGKAELIAECAKAHALDLVDAEAAKLALSRPPAQP